MGAKDPTSTKHKCDLAARTVVSHELGFYPGSGTLGALPGYDDDDWVGEPPEGRYTRDRAKPQFWNRPWPLAWAGMLLLIIIVVVVVLVAR